jgi:methionyl-tRNA formyltransferase
MTAGKKIVLLIGNARRHRYFADSLAAAFPLSGIVIEKKYSAKNRAIRFLARERYNPLKMIRKLYFKQRLRAVDRRYVKTEAEMLRSDRPRVPIAETCPLLFTNSINAPKVERYLHDIAPDIVLVSGTSLIEKRLISADPNAVLINMHTGLSPYYRGGPCTFWCLYNEELQFLGVTIHYLTAGVDSGDIIVSRRMTDIKPDDNEATLDCKVIRLGTQLMIETVEKLIKGASLPAVRQWEHGRVFRSRDFAPAKRLDLERKLRQGLIEYYLRSQEAHAHDHIRTVN